MPEDKHSKLLQPPRTSEKKKTKKKRRKTRAFTVPPENTQKPQAATLLPKLRVTSEKDREQLGGSGQRSKKVPKDLPAPLTATNKTSASGDAVQGYVSELRTEARESLRWEGVLQDPPAEEKRLELYRANRRQRYITHRETLLKETQDALRQIFPKETTEKKGFD